MPHLYWVWKTNEAGQTRRGRLLDASGPVDLSQFDSVSVVIKRKSTDTVRLVNETVVIDANQNDNTGTTAAALAATNGCGWFTYTISSTAAGLTVQTPAYIVEFPCVDGLITHNFPKDKNGNQTYGQVYVQRPL
jgi:hypothetical protein